jgi:nitrite reductase/ring-hydroxylating ferredoxin subunit
MKLINFVFNSIQYFKLMKSGKSFLFTLTVAFLFTSVIFFASSCKKDDTDDIAQYYVDFTIFINEPAYINLNAVGGWMYINAGTKGIIIYRRSQTEFTALERNCTYDPNAACSLVEVLSGISAVDSCCTSRFSIFDGSVINGPATRPLYQYRTTFDGVALRVFN